MIAYEELERALARWKARRTTAGTQPQAAAAASDAGMASEVTSMGSTEDMEYAAAEQTADVVLSEEAVVDEN